MADTRRAPLRGPRIVKTPPGPKSRAAMAAKERFVSNGVRVGLPIDLVRAEGPFVEDADGNVYVDLTTGIGVQNFGHRPAAAVRAAKAQLDAFTHISFMVAMYDPYIDLAKAMARLCPPGLTKSIFLNSGSEAIENAVKIARAATRRAWLISFRTSFHGRTLLGLSLMGRHKPYRAGFGPFLRETLLCDYPYVYRDPEGRGPADVANAAIDRIEREIAAADVKGNVAAIFAEPVQGEGGIIVPPKEFFPALRKLCDTHGIVLVDDEVQAGMGRTGRVWATEHWQTVPDLLVSGKAVGAGLPFGGVTGKPAFMDAPNPGSLGGTFGGNPAVCAAALEAVSIVRKAIRGVPRLERMIRSRLAELQEADPHVGDVRGLGAMWALELVKDPRTKEPDPDRARAVQLEAMRRGVMLLTAGFYGNCVRLLPPLTISPSLLESSLDIVADALEASA